MRPIVNYIVNYISSLFSPLFLLDDFAGISDRNAAVTTREYVFAITAEVPTNPSKPTATHEQKFRVLLMDKKSLLKLNEVQGSNGLDEWAVLDGDKKGPGSTYWKERLRMLSKLARCVKTDEGPEAEGNPERKWVGKLMLSVPSSQLQFSTEMAALSDKVEKLHDRQAGGGDEQRPDVRGRRVGCDQSGTSSGFALEPNSAQRGGPIDLPLIGTSASSGSLSTNESFHTTTSSGAHSDYDPPPPSPDRAAGGTGGGHEDGDLDITATKSDAGERRALSQAKDTKKRSDNQARRANSNNTKRKVKDKGGGRSRQVDYS